MLELTGLASPPCAVLTTAPSGHEIALPKVYSIADLKANSKGGFVTTRLSENCYTLYVCLPDGTMGHFVSIHL